MTKKEFKKLKEGDSLIVTRISSEHFYPLGEIVEVKALDKESKEVKCISTIDGLRQRLYRKDLALIRR